MFRGDQKPDPTSLVGLRQIKAVLRVATVGNVNGAAHLMGRSQTAVSKSLSQIEAALGAKLFLRSSAGLTLTESGRHALARFRTIEALFMAAARQYEEFHRKPANPASIPLFTMDIAVRRLRQLVALETHPTIEEAAASQGVSGSATYKGLHELESHLDTRLFARLPGGHFIPIEYGRMLIPKIKLILREIENAVEDVARLNGERRGRVAIGCRPSMSAWVIPTATMKMLEVHPEIMVETHEAPYHELIEQLLSGKLDAIVGGLKAAQDMPDLRLEQIFTDQVCIIGRAQHPLAHRENLTPADFRNVRWVLPVWMNASQPIFEQMLLRAGIEFVNPRIGHASVLTLNGLLLSSDCLTVGTRLQSQQALHDDRFAIISFRLPDDVWPSGIVTRSSTEPSAGARLFLPHIRDTIKKKVMMEPKLMSIDQAASRAAPPTIG